MVVTITGIITHCSGMKSITFSNGRVMRYEEYIIRDAEDTQYFFYAADDDIDKYALAECMNITVNLWLYSRFVSKKWKNSLRLIGICNHQLPASVVSTEMQRKVESTSKVNAPVMTQVSFQKH